MMATARGSLLIFHLILLNMLQRRYPHSHFTEEDIEIKGIEESAQDLKARR